MLDLARSDVARDRYDLLARGNKRSNQWPANISGRSDDCEHDRTLAIAIIAANREADHGRVFR
jgi:hypothetical protein